MSSPEQGNSQSPPAETQVIPEVQTSIETQKFNKDNMRRVPLAAMNPAPYNPRIMTPEAEEGLKFSMERWGLVENLVWNERSGNLVGGHRRYKILKEAGQMDAMTCVLDLDEEEEKMLNLALNNPAIQGTFDNRMLSDLIKMLKFAKKPEEFKKSGLMALERQLPLFEENKPVGKAGVEQQKADVATGKAGKATAAEAAALPQSDVRMVQLFLKIDQHKKFMQDIAKLCAALGTDNVTDTVLKLVGLAMSKLEPPAPAPAPAEPVQPPPAPPSAPAPNTPPAGAQEAETPAPQA